MDHRKLAPERAYSERKISRSFAPRGIRNLQAMEDAACSRENNRQKPFFPIFVSLEGKRAAVVGGGRVAARRAKTLISFGATVRFISGDISPEAAALVRGGKASWLKIEFEPQLLEGFDIVVASSGSRSVNRKVSEAAKKMRILVSVSDCREESTYIFPSVVQGDSFIAGFIASGNDYDVVRRIAKKLCEFIKTDKI